MDKDFMKRLLRDHGIPVCKFVAIREKDREHLDYQEISGRLGQVLFVKPANLGSSVGISRAVSREDFEKAVDTAFQYDTKVIIEEEVKGREIECAILGNDNPVASVPGEIIPKKGFYSYAAKYIDSEGAALEIPARLPKHLVIRIQDMAVATFKALEGRGMARVDFFLTRKEEVFVNEINTIPGFTRISMYPKLWEYSGIPYSDLIDKLINLALQDFEKRRNLK
jgi:D-alanine-D-alanine ligase